MFLVEMASIQEAFLVTPRAYDRGGLSRGDHRGVLQADYPKNVAEGSALVDSVHQGGQFGCSAVCNGV